MSWQKWESLNKRKKKKPEHCRNQCWEPLPNQNLSMKLKRYCIARDTICCVWIWEAEGLEAKLAPATAFISQPWKLTPSWAEQIRSDPHLQIIFSNMHFVCSEKKHVCLGGTSFKIRSLLISKPAAIDTLSKSYWELINHSMCNTKHHFLHKS